MHQTLNSSLPKLLCTAGQAYFTISPDGNVWRCWTHQHESCGSVSQGILNSWPSLNCPAQTCRNCESSCVTVKNQQTGKERIGLYAAPGDSTDNPQLSHAIFRAMPTLSCNYTCPYCIVENNQSFQVGKPNRKTLPPEEWETWWLKVVKPKYERIDVYVSGGEPGLYHGFERFILAVDQLPGRHWIASNLSFPERMTPFFEGRIKNFLVAASAHLSDPKFNPDSFLETIKKTSQHVDVYVKMIDDANNQNLPLAREFSERLRRECGMGLKVAKDKHSWVAPGLRYTSEEIPEFE